MCPTASLVAADGTTLIADSDEQALLEAIRTARQRGLSQRAVVAELTRQGLHHPQRHGILADAGAAHHAAGQIA